MCAVVVPNSNTGPSRDELQRFMERADNELRPLFHRCTVPIVSEKDGQPLLYGTGTLFRVADESFVVTAHHVFPQAAEQGISSLYITDHRSKSEMIRLDGEAVGAEDPEDVLCHHLPGEAVASLKNRSFLNLADVLFENRPRQTLYFVYGFPAALLRTDIAAAKATSVGMLIRTEPYDRDTDLLPSYSAAHHLALWALPQDGKSPEGATVEPLRLGGMSGCSMWQVHQEGADIDCWKPADAKVVAVQTTAYGTNKIIQGTYWLSILRLLWIGFPRLRPAIAIHTGPL